MISQAQGDRARHECHRGQVLAQPVMQFLAQSLLLTVAYGEDFAFEPFAALDLAFQLRVCHPQLARPLANASLQ
jgi:hypothetical protein